jgi:coenzyme F420-0:L-glutamate ligase/coenzyme F420-1:gamma-L-glutamate ligase
MIAILPVRGMPEIEAGDDLAALLCAALAGSAAQLVDGDVLVVTSKVVSKAERRTVWLDEVSPSPFASSWAAQHGKDARHVEVVLRECRRIVRMDRGVLLAETRHGFVCANAGVDASNAASDGQLLLLPVDPDASARRLREALRERTGIAVAVVISDTFGRPWRNGETNVAIGASGIGALRSYVGEQDSAGRTLLVTSIAVVDELAAAAELAMGKLDRVPAAIIRGYAYQPPAQEADADDTGDGGAAALVRAPETDMFR